MHRQVPFGYCNIAQDHDYVHMPRLQGLDHNSITEISSTVKEGGKQAAVQYSVQVMSINVPIRDLAKKYKNRKYDESMDAPQLLR